MNRNREGAIGRVADWLDRDFVIDELYKNGTAMSHAKELSEVRDFVIEAIQMDGRAFRSVAPEFKSDLEVVLVAVKSYGRNLELVDPEFRGVRIVVNEAVKRTGSALEFATDELRADRDIVLAAITGDGSALKFAAEELKADRELVLEAVKRHVHALQYASDELKRDREVVFAAVAHNTRALDNEFARLEFQPSTHALELCAPEFRNDREVVLAAVGYNGLALRCASDELRGDREVVEKAIRENGDALQYALTGPAGEHYLEDEEFVRFKERMLIFRWSLDGADLGERLLQRHVTVSGAGDGGEVMWLDTTLLDARSALAQLLSEDLHAQGEKRIVDPIEVQLVLDGNVLNFESDKHTLRYLADASLRQPNGDAIVTVSLLDAEVAEEVAAEQGPPTAERLREMAEEAQQEALALKRKGKTQDAVFAYRKMMALQKQAEEQAVVDKANAAARQIAQQEAAARAKEEERIAAEAEAKRLADEKIKKAAEEKRARRAAKAAEAAEG